MAESIYALIDDRQSLPPMPEVAQKIIESFSDELISLKEVAEIVSLDPAISARVVGLANSAYFAVSDEVTSVEEAMIRSLGLDLTRGIAIGMACGNTFDLSQCPRFRTDQFWRVSLNTSAISSRFAQYSSLTQLDPGTCGLAGLLENIGYLGFAALRGSEFNDILGDERVDIGQMTQERFDCSAQDVGMALAKSWDLPRSIQNHFEMRAEQKKMTDLDADASATGSWTVVEVAGSIVCDRNFDFDDPEFKSNVDTLALTCPIDKIDFDKICEQSEAAAKACA